MRPSKEVPLKPNLTENIITKIAKSVFHNHAPNVRFTHDQGFLALEHSHCIAINDAIIEGEQIPIDSLPEHYAWKLISRAFNSLSAMGGIPQGCAVNIKINNKVNKTWIRSFFKELDLLLHTHHVTLLAGSTLYEEASKISMSITVLGAAHKIMKHSNGYDGDRIYCSGYIGDAYLGHQIYMNTLVCSSKEDKAYFLKSYLQPTSHVMLGQKLSEYTNCAINISTGLIPDVAKLAHYSRLMAFVSLENIPLSQAAQDLLKNYKPKERNKMLSQMITHSHDCQILFSASISREYEIVDIANELQLPLTSIGHLTAYQDSCVNGEEKNFVRIFDKKGEEVSLSRSSHSDAA